MRNYGENLKKLIERQPLPHREFCRKAGISTGTLFAAFQSVDGKGVSKKTNAKIAAALGVTPELLLGDERSVEPVLRLTPQPDQERVYAWFLTLPPALQKHVLGQLPEGLEVQILELEIGRVKERSAIRSLIVPRGMELSKDEREPSPDASPREIVERVGARTHRRAAHVQKIENPGGSNGNK